MSRIHIEITLGILLVVLTSIVMIIMGFNEETRMERYAVGEVAQSIEVGAGLFENNCSGCHGLTGEGVPNLCPPLNDRHFFTDRLKEVGWTGSLEDYIIATVSSGRLQSTRPEQYVGGGKPAMPAWSERYGGPLRDDQIRDIARFVTNWEATALEQVELVEVTSPISEDPVERGQIVYTSNGCSGCHTLGSLSAGTTGPVLTNIGTLAETRIADVTAEEYLRQSVLNPNAYVVEGFNPDVMPKTFGDTLTDDELSDLVAFLLAQK